MFLGQKSIESLRKRHLRVSTKVCHISLQKRDFPQKKLKESIASLRERPLCFSTKESHIPLLNKESLKTRVISHMNESCQV
mmetsp:Transcript_87056/g.127322  ORF Transcript_87056/g.127322 Transcript_87056/m.127322 type:complete len:81 (-) Transcript_87056:339-581(-)